MRRRRTDPSLVRYMDTFIAMRCSQSTDLYHRLEDSSTSITLFRRNSNPGKRRVSTVNKASCPALCCDCQQRPSATLPPKSLDALVSLEVLVVVTIGVHAESVREAHAWHVSQAPVRDARAATTRTGKICNYAIISDFPFACQISSFRLISMRGCSLTV